MTTAEAHAAVTAHRERELERLRWENQILKRLVDVGWPPQGFPLGGRSPKKRVVLTVETF